MAASVASFFAGGEQFASIPQRPRNRQFVRRAGDRDGAGCRDRIRAVATAADQNEQEAGQNGGAQESRAADIVASRVRHIVIRSFSFS